MSKRHSRERTASGWVANQNVSVRILLVLALSKVKLMRGVDQEWEDEAIAQIPILGTTITLSRLRKRGYISMADYYSKVKL